MFGTSIEIQLTPQRVSLKRRRYGLRSRFEEVQAIAVAPVCDDRQPSWHSAVAACAELQAGQQAKDLQFVFSDIWVRYDLIQVGVNELSDAEMISLAQAHFTHLYPDIASWPLRLARQGKQLLIAATDPAFLGALEESANMSGKQMSRAEPLFSRVFDLYAAELSDFDGWMLLDESGVLVAAYVEKGKLLSFRSQLCESRREEAAHLLLKRQEALLERTATKEVWIFSCTDHPLSLGEPWRSSRITTIYDLQA